MEKRLSHRGFTLIEILIAVTIFSVLILTVFSSFRTFLTSSHAVKRRVDADRMAGPCLQQIGRDMESLFVLPVPRYSPPGIHTPPDPFRMTGSETAAGDGVFSRLSFASLNHVPLGPDKRAGVGKIVYYVRPNSGGGYDLCRSDRLGVRAEAESSCTDPVLLRDVIGFDCRFVDAEGNEHRYWDTDSEEFQYQYPHHMDILLSFRVDGMTGKAGTSIRLPVGRGGVR